MIKLKNKIIITLFIILLSINSICFATNDVMLISENTQVQEPIYSDLYISDKNQYDITNSIEGNVYASVDTLNISSNSNNIIRGNLYALAKNINIKSDYSYSDSEIDSEGNKKLSVNNPYIIYGNVYAVANKFVLDPDCEIHGDLYICANEVYLEQSSEISGNVFVTANVFSCNSKINGDLYANVKNFDMKYYGTIFRDLHLTSEKASLNGYIYRNSFISAEDITTLPSFINKQDFNIENATNLSFSGKVNGNANINSKNIEFKTETNCSIAGNLNYSSIEELQISNGVVTGNINYSKYKNSSNLLPNVLDFILGLMATLAYVTIIYFIMSKFMPKYIEKLSNLSIRDALIALGLGLGILILVPIISIILLISQIGSLIGLLLLAIYIILLIIAKPILIIYISSIIKNKISINSYLIISLLTLILSLLNLIPYLGFIVSILVIITGIGLLGKILFSK